MRGVIYARYSTELQSAASVEDQIRICREHIERAGWSYLTAYFDRGMSGASRFRPGYQKLIEDAREGLFDVVVAEALDRLSRDQEDVAALYKQLTFARVRLVTLAEGEISELHVGLKGTMNALFLKDLADKTRRGLRGRVEQGRSGGGRCYGYRVVRENDARGEPVRGAREIDSAEAVIVRRVFEAFAAGQSPRAIARALNEENVPGPDGQIWHETTLRGHHARRTGLLRNELYVGRLVWNRQRYVKDPSTGKRLARPNPESDWIVEAVAELRIVDDVLWARVETRLSAIRETPRAQKIRRSEFWKHRRPRHLLTGLASCGLCGGALSQVGKDYLACARARDTGACDNRRGIRRADVEQVILDGLRHRLMAPDLVREFMAAFHEELNRAAREREHEHVLRERRLAEVTRKLDGLVDAIAEGYRAPGLQGKLDALEREAAALRADLAAAPAPAPRLHPSLAEDYRRRVASLHEALADAATRTEAVEQLRSLISAVRVRPGEAGWEIELEGDVAAMVAAAGSGTNENAGPVGPAVREVFLSSVKVVAGRGFEPLTFRL